MLLAKLKVKKRKRYSWPLATVDGRHPAPFDRWFIPLLMGLSTIQHSAGFLPPS
jgi:hypothetical protein